MKFLKVSLFLLTALIIYSVSGFVGVSAVDSEVTWTMDTSATEHSLQGAFEFGTGVNEVTIYVPESIDIVLDNGLDTLTIYFYDSSDVLTDTLDGETEFGDIFYNDFGSIGAYYQFNFEMLNIDSTAVKLLFIIPTDYTTSSPSDSTYIDYVNDNTTVSINTGETVYGLFRFAWEELAGTSSNYLQSNEIEMPTGTEYIGLRYNFDIYERIFDAESTLYFYDADDVLIASALLYLNTTAGDDDNVYGSIDISLSDLSEDYETISYFTLKMAIWLYSPTVLYSHNNNLIYIVDGEVSTVNFYSGTDIVYSHKTLIGAIARYPITHPDGGEGKEFSHWITANGVEYNFTAISEDMFILDTVNFYAIFDNIPDEAVGIVTDSEADEDSLFTELLTKVGFNDPIERTIVFGFVAIFTAGLMFWRGLGTMSVVIVVGGELFFFMYLGIIPIFVAIIMILLLVYIGVSTRGAVADG